MMVKLNSLCSLFAIQRHLNGVPCIKNEEKKVFIKMWTIVSSTDKVPYCQIQNMGLKNAYTKNQLVSLSDTKI